MQKRLSLMLLFVLIGMISFAQSNDTLVIRKKLPITKITARQNFSNDTARYKYDMYKKYVAVVWPYVLEGSKLMKEINEGLNGEMKRKDRKKFIKEKELEFKLKFEDKIKNLNKTQGAILLKLLNRQLSPTTVFAVVKDMKGNLSAISYQAKAELFGFNLNEKYIKSEEEELEKILWRMGLISDEEYQNK